MCHTFVSHTARPTNEKAADPFESAASAFLVVMGRKWNPNLQPRNHAGFSRIWHLRVV